MKATSRVYQTTAARNAINAQRRAQAMQDFRADHPKLVAWLASSKLSFAQSLNDAFHRYGTLTVNQMEAARNCMHQQQERAQQVMVMAVNIDVSKIETAFSMAQSKGVKRPRMRLGDYMFSTAPATGANAGALYVKASDESQTYMGKVVGGKFVRSALCNDTHETQIIELAGDPMKAAIAYGRRTGECAICGRELSNHASIELGIGPICAGKFGF